MTAGCIGRYEKEHSAVGADARIYPVLEEHFCGLCAGDTGTGGQISAQDIGPFTGRGNGCRRRDHPREMPRSRSFPAEFLQ